METKRRFLGEIEKFNPSWIVSDKDSVWMVTLVTLIGPMCLLFREVIRKLFPVPAKNCFRDFFLDCICFLAPIILSLTVASEFLIQNFAAFFIILFILILYTRTKSKTSVDEPYPLSGYGFPFLNSYRALVNLCTIIVILAVDFPQIFPQTFHKRYTKGYSLMDTGVGSFIFSHALVAPESRNKHISIPILQRMKECLGSSSMLIALGCGRLFVTWMTNYSVSEEEYGKHWNFFFTLACVKLFITIIFCVVPKSAKRYPWMLATTIGVIYQVLLLAGGYKDWIIVGDNKDGSYTGNFIHANRPGLFSTIGYCSLYLFGVQIGRAVFESRPLWGNQLKFMQNLSAIVVVAGLLTWLLNSYVDKSSRMIANLTFILWQVMHNTALLLGSLIADLICAMFYSHDLPLIPGQCKRCYDRKSTPSCSCLLSAINKNQLFFFLIGNVSTGLVNLSMKTGSVSQYASVLSLFTYGVFVCGITCIFFVNNITTKFW